MKFYLHTIIGRDIDGGTETRNIDVYLADGAFRSPEDWAETRVRGTDWYVIEATAEEVKS